MTGDSVHASQVWKRLIAAHPEVHTKCANFQFPGQGQRPTPTAPTPVLVEIAWLCPGKTAKVFRRQGAVTLCRAFGGDLSLVDEIERRHSNIVGTETQARLLAGTGVTLEQANTGRAETDEGQDMTPREKLEWEAYRKRLMIDTDMYEFETSLNKRRKAVELELARCEQVAEFVWRYKKRGLDVRGLVSDALLLKEWPRQPEQPVQQPEQPEQAPADPPERPVQPVQQVQQVQQPEQVPEQAPVPRPEHSSRPVQTQPPLSDQSARSTQQPPQSPHRPGWGSLPLHQERDLLAYMLRRITVRGKKSHDRGQFGPGGMKANFPLPSIELIGTAIGEVAGRPFVYNYNGVEYPLPSFPSEGELRTLHGMMKRHGPACETLETYVRTVLKAWPVPFGDIIRRYIPELGRVWPMRLFVDPAYSTERVEAELLVKTDNWDPSLVRFRHNCLRGWSCNLAVGRRILEIVDGFHVAKFGGPVPLANR